MGMTQEMADIIGAAALDPGCKVVVRIMKEDEPELYLSELRHCIFSNYMIRMDDGSLAVTGYGVDSRREAIDAGTVRA